MQLNFSFQRGIGKFLLSHVISIKKQHLTCFQKIEAFIAHSCSLKVPIPQRCFVSWAMGAHHLATGTAMVSANKNIKFNGTILTHCYSAIGYPNWSRVSYLGCLCRCHLQVSVAIAYSRREGSFPTDVILNGTAKGIKPLISLYYSRCSKGTAANRRSYVEFVLVVLGGRSGRCVGNTNLKGWERNLVGHAKACRVTWPASWVGAVEKTVTQENKISWSNSFSCLLYTSDAADE